MKTLHIENDKRKIEGHTTDAVDKQVWKKMDVKKANEKGNRENDVKNSQLKRTSKMGVLLVEPKSELKFKGKLNYPFNTNCLNAENMWFLSHLLIAGCDIGVQISVRPSVLPFVPSSTFTSKLGFLYISES